MNWPVYIYQKLVNNADWIALVPEGSLFASGSMVEVPHVRPFVVIRFGQDLPLSPGTQTEMSLWAHDEPGSYDRINTILSHAREILEGPVLVPGGIDITWTGNSIDLADNQYGTIVRNGNYLLTGRNIG